MNQIYGAHVLKYKSTLGEISIFAESPRKPPEPSKEESVALSYTAIIQTSNMSGCSILPWTSGWISIARARILHSGQHPCTSPVVSKTS